jgi:ribosomal protein S8E
MNKRSVKKKRPAKAGRSPAVRKSSARAAASRKLVSRQSAKKSAPVRATKAASAAKASTSTAKKSSAVKVSSVLNMPEFAKFSEADKIVASDIGSVSVAEVTATATPLRTHKFRVGQTVSYTSSPISRPGASGSYQVVRLLPSDGDDYQYRIKNPGEAFERVAKESQLELDH